MIVVGVRAYPEPDHIISIPHRERPIGQTHACRKDGTRDVDLLESKTRVKRILPKQLIGQTRLGLNLRRQGNEGLAKPLGRMRVQSRSGSSGRVRPDRCSSSASSARPASTPGFLANDASQRPSTLTSSRIAAANASCSAGGSLAAASNAFLSLFVMGAI